MTDLEAILAHVPGAILAIARLGGLIIFAPLLSSPVIPIRIKVFLAVILGLIATPLLTANQYMPAIPADIWLLAPMIVTEIVIGMAIGFAAALPLIGVQMGGQIMGYQMGLGFAQLYNPMNSDEADVIGQAMFLMALVGFLLIGGHEALFLAVLHSFAHLPIGSPVLELNLVGLLGGMLLASFELALRVAAPLLALMLLLTVAMGFISKTLPQFNIFSLGFPIRILSGLAMLALGLVVIESVLIAGIHDALSALYTWMEAT